MLNCNIFETEFKFQSRYYVYFRSNTLEKGMNPPNPPNYELNYALLFFYKDDFGIK